MIYELLNSKVTIYDLKEMLKQVWQTRQNNWEYRYSIVYMCFLNLKFVLVSSGFLLDKVDRKGR